MLLRSLALRLSIALALAGCAQGATLDENPSGSGSGGAKDGGADQASAGGAGGSAGSAGAGAGGSSAGAAGSGATAGSAAEGGAAGSGGGAGESGGAGLAGSAGAAGAGGANPCEGITCNNPPASTCASATQLHVYGANGYCDAGQCVYPASDVDCTGGCVNDACANDACIGVTCNNPTPNVCADASYLTVYDVPGSCSLGQCAYGSHAVFCSFGCAGIVCNGDPCTGMTCASPLANYCADANNLNVYETPGTCNNGTCTYASHTEFCSFGCNAGACTNDPCAGVSCTTPQANYCTNATTLRTYSASGTCGGAGTCTYPNTDTACTYGCVSGVCQNCSIDADCGAGKWCSSGTCLNCTTDQHCGTACTNCTATSKVCSGGTTCVQCITNAQCGAGNWCNAGTCAPCNDATHCGSSCVACSGTTPSCNGSSCECTASSCGSYKQCVTGACVECNSDSACGAACTACIVGTPKCWDQGSTSSCVQCLSNADCGGGQTCNTSTHVCGAATCGPGNCAFCCDDSTTCNQYGMTNDQHCGKNGVACTDCSVTGRWCNNGYCQ